MDRKTNYQKNGYHYYRITKVIGKKLNEHNTWVDNKKEFYGKTKAEAENKLQNFLKNRKNYIDNSKFFGEIADYFIYNVFLNSNVAEGTKEKYIRVYKQFLRRSSAAGKLISNLRSREFQDIYNSSGCAVSTLRATNNILRRIYKYIEIEGYGKDITANIVVPEPEVIYFDEEDDILVWPEKEIDAIIQNLDNTRHRLTVLIGLYTGCRIEEVSGLTYDSIDLGKKEIKISKQLILKYDKETKTRTPIVSRVLKTKNAYRIIPLSDFLLNEIKEHHKRHQREMVENGYSANYIFTTKNRILHDFSNVARELKRFYKKIGVSYKSFHVYRHTFATKITQNVDIQVASKLLGHESIAVTAKYYVDISDEEKRAAIDSLDFRSSPKPQI